MSKLKTTSTQQYAANCNNAKKGGVKTQQGKEISCMNALKHGILSQKVLMDEQDTYRDVYTGLREEIKPNGLVESVLVERIATHILQMRRIAHSRNEFLLQCANPGKVIDFIDDIASLGKEVIEEPYKPEIEPEQVSQLFNLYQRYETAIENRFYKAIHELKQYRLD